MQSILRISDAAAIALHAADYLARQEKPVSSTADIADALRVSHNHLSKVLQRLTKAGLLRPERGPRGGFALSASGRTAKVRDFISAIDGPPVIGECLLKHKVCGASGCAFGSFIRETNVRYEKVLNSRISAIRRN